MLVTLVESGGPIAGDFEGEHQTDDGVRVVGVLGYSDFPPVDRPAPIRGRLGLLRERLEHPSVGCGQPLPLPFRPLIELDCVAQKEAVEEWTGVERGGSLEVAAHHGLLERDQVARNHLRIELQVVSRRKDGFGPKGPPKDVDRLIQETAAPFRIAFGPQPGHELIAAQRSRVLTRQEREQRQAVPVDRAPGQDATVALQGSSAQELEGKHHRSVNRSASAGRSAVHRLEPF